MVGLKNAPSLGGNAHSLRMTYSHPPWVEVHHPKATTSSDVTGAVARSASKRMVDRWQTEIRALRSMGFLRGRMLENESLSRCRVSQNTVVFKG